MRLCGLLINEKGGVYTISLYGYFEIGRHEAKPGKDRPSFCSAPSFENLFCHYVFVVTIPSTVSKINSMKTSYSSLACGF